MKTLCAVLLLLAASAHSAAGPESLFPMKVGDTKVYIIFGVHRADTARKALNTQAIYREVVEQRSFKGVRAFVVRNSYGKVQTSGGLGMSVAPPDTIHSEDIFLVTPLGVDWRMNYQGSSPADLLKMREKILSGLSKLSPKQLAKEMDNWVLPWPTKPGAKRSYDKGTGAYTVAKTADMGLLRKGLDRKGLVAVEGNQFGKWKNTRWYAPGKGLVQLESANTDPETAAEFPVNVEQLFR